jgi:hypothetical protein
VWQKICKYEDPINHARHIHHHPIVKCHECGKEFIHEKDRLRHAREEHEKKIDGRELKNLFEHKSPSPQENVDLHRKNFSDNF